MFDVDFVNFILAGTTLCTNSPADPLLLELVRKEIVHLKYDVGHYSFESDENRKQLKLKLEEVENHFQKQIDRLKIGRASCRERV